MGLCSQISSGIYSTLTWVKLDYGCIVHSQTFHYLINLLDPVQNESMQIATGAFRSSPKVCLEFEANVMPLSLLPEHIVCTSYLRFQTPEQSVQISILQFYRR